MSIKNILNQANRELTITEANSLALELSNGRMGVQEESGLPLLVYYRARPVVDGGTPDGRKIREVQIGAGELTLWKIASLAHAAKAF